MSRTQRWASAFFILILPDFGFGPPVDPACPQSTRAERLSSLVETLTQAKERFRQEIRDSRDNDEGRTAAEERRYRVETEVAKEALALALADPRGDVAAEALRFVVVTESRSIGPPTEAVTRALEVLARDHAGDPGMGELCGQLRRFFELPAAEDLIRSVLEHNPSRTERATAHLELAGYLRTQAARSRRLRDNPVVLGNFERARGKEAIARFLRKDPDALDRLADVQLERVASQFGDVMLGKRKIADIAAGELHSQQRLSIGSLAPEIEGRDHEGKLFRLGDYRGKIVVLTFSGNWCIPCRSMYPAERELLRRMQGKSFALLGVNTDAEVGTLVESIAAGEITWRCWWDGGDERPITTRWGVQSFPTIYVIDHHGIIRFKPSRAENLGELVDKLATELPAEQP
ncbi:MAG: TlpA disulfide reductase family protein [Isosphaeraceae bacterium]|nr:TlpA disulfide reductase family protein [Isosphaeraceae bacterium]